MHKVDLFQPRKVAGLQKFNQVLEAHVAVHQPSGPNCWQRVFCKVFLHPFPGVVALSEYVGNAGKFVFQVIGICEIKQLFTGRRRFQKEAL